jgi:peptide/nickel transport system substrate-binding protein
MDDLMKRNYPWLILSCLLVLSLILVSCGTKTTPTITTMTTAPTSAATIKTTTTPTFIPTSTPITTAGAPQYGGTFNYRTNRDIVYFDPYFGDVTPGGTLYAKLWIETLCVPDLKIDHNIWDFKTGYTPVEYWTGRVAENWEQPDAQTIIFHIRKGVQWQNRPPVNGRELTAYDFEYGYHRQLGLGSGFTKASPYIAASNYALIKSITATDKYTLVFKLSQPSLDQIRMIIDDNPYVAIVPRESVQQYGDLSDWRHAIGTGPFMIEDYTSASSLSAVRNPNYWDYDTLYPNNRLPYFDKVKILIIPDNATAEAALRSGKIDMIEDIDWQQAASIAKTNPELLKADRPTWGFAITLMVDKKPFDDIRVRKAMQMAVDIPTIAATYFGGSMVSTPMGKIGLKGYYTPFSEWPQEVKDGYIYNPSGAKKLLSEAGYPGSFKTSMTVRSTDDMGLIQILKSYLLDIGIDVEIKPMDPAAFTAYTQAGLHEMCTGLGTIPTNPPINCLNNFYSKHVSYKSDHIKDQIYDDLVEKAMISLDLNEFKQLIIQADMRAITQQWAVTLPSKTIYTIYQPWLKGFHGEANVIGRLSSKLWIDQSVK